MSHTNSPDPAVRKAAVRQELDNVLHPIVQHKVLESRQMVVTGGQNSTIFDADGTGYLDAMAGLWCVNIGYGRVELAEDRGRSDAAIVLLSAYRNEPAGRGVG